MAILALAQKRQGKHPQIWEDGVLELVERLTSSSEEMSDADEREAALALANVRTNLHRDPGPESAKSLRAIAFCLYSIARQVDGSRRIELAAQYLELIAQVRVEHPMRTFTLRVA